MDPSGGRRTRLTRARPQVEIAQAVFSPDGRNIAFVRIDRGNFQVFRAWVMKANGAKPHVVSPWDALVVQVDWRPIRG